VDIIVGILEILNRCSDVGEHVLGAIHRTGHHLAGDISHSTRNITSDIGNSTGKVLKSVHDASANELEATRDIGMSLQKGQCDTSMMLHKAVCDVESDINDTAKDFALSNVEHQRDILSAVWKQGKKNQKTSAKYGVKGQKTTVKQSGKTRERIREESYKNLCGQKELLLEGRDTREKLLEKMCDSDRRAAKYKSEILLDACKNKGELQQQIADCCCELKQLIVNDGDATRELIQSSTIDSLRSQISLLNIELLNAGITPLAVRASKNN